MNQWQDICDKDELIPNAGVCALWQDRQVALFRTLDDRLFAVGNHDPIGGANVLSRGLLAEVQGKLTVASPLYKHHYCLESGQCLDDQDVQIPVYRVRVKDNRVQLASEPSLK